MLRFRSSCCNRCNRNLSGTRLFSGSPRPHLLRLLQVRAALGDDDKAKPKGDAPAGKLSLVFFCSLGGVLVVAIELGVAHRGGGFLLGCCRRWYVPPTWCVDACMHGRACVQIELVKGQHSFPPWFELWGNKGERFQERARTET